MLWDSIKFKCTEKVLGSFSVTVKLNSDEEGSFWLSSVYGPNKEVWREDFWLELQDLHGLTFPRWCVGGDFNVIRRISEKMGDSRLTVNMRRFDEFIRESGLLDPLLGMRLLHGQTCKWILFARDWIGFCFLLSGILFSLKVFKRRFLDGPQIIAQFAWKLIL